MKNELILMVSVVCTYSLVLLFYKLFGKTGLYVWTAFATITANIEVLMVVNAFGLEQTLGNILFASTFLATDILSENVGKKAANKAVAVGIASSLSFIIISRSWFLYAPSESDFATPAIREIFSQTPRLMLVSIAVYAVCQAFDVFAYHAIWSRTQKLFGDSKKGLWIRNNGSTLLSQLINTLIFTFGAFYGVYDTAVLWDICLATYVIYVCTSLLDTPAVYISRRIASSGEAAK